MENVEDGFLFALLRDEQQPFHERIADLNVWPLGAGIFAKTGGCHRRAVNTVTPGFGSNINYGITDTVSAAVEDLVLFENSQRERIHQGILGIASSEINFATDRRNTEPISVARNPADHAFD